MVRELIADWIQHFHHCCWKRLWVLVGHFGQKLKSCIQIKNENPWMIDIICFGRDFKARIC